MATTVRELFAVSLTGAISDSTGGKKAHCLTTTKRSTPLAEHVYASQQEQCKHNGVTEIDIQTTLAAPRNPKP